MIGLPELFFILPILVLAAGATWVLGVNRGGRSAHVAFVVVGIVVLTVVTAGVAFAVANRSKIAAFYRNASSALSEMATVQKVLVDKFGGTVSVAVKHQGRVDAATLSVAVVNPSFLDQLDPAGPEAREKAREIAAAARDALPNASSYGKVEVVFVRQQGVGFTLTRSWAFSFDPSELPH